MRNQSTAPKLSSYNEQVQKAYFKILKQAKVLIASVEQHEIRCSLYLENRTKLVTINKVHEFVSPLIYMCLMSLGDDYTIHFGFDVFGGSKSSDGDFTELTSKFVRILYKLTSAEFTLVNIEKCVTTYNVITECTELFDYMEERGKSNHTFELIPYKPKPVKRNLRKVA